jgi:hypothetical protein
LPKTKNEVSRGETLQKNRPRRFSMRAAAPPSGAILAPYPHLRSAGAPVQAPKSSTSTTATGGFYGSDGACPPELGIVPRSCGRLRPLPAPSWRLILTFVRRGLRFKPPKATA